MLDSSPTITAKKGLSSRNSRFAVEVG
jgi:hypothetical protein